MTSWLRNTFRMSDPLCGEAASFNHHSLLLTSTCSWTHGRVAGIGNAMPLMWLLCNEPMIYATIALVQVCSNSIARLTIYHFKFAIILNGECSIYSTCAQYRVHHELFCSLRWRQNGRNSVSNHQPHDCLLNRLFRRRSKKPSRLHVTGLCVGNSPGTGEFPAQMASNAENVSIWWRHHVSLHIAECHFHPMNGLLISSIKQIEILSTWEAL